MSGTIPAALDVQVQDAAGANDFALSLADADVTVAELLDILGMPPTGVLIDGEVVRAPASTRVIDVVSPGSQLALADSPHRPESTVLLGDAAIEVAVVAGLRAGSTERLCVGVHRIGELPDDPTSGWFVRVDRSDLAAARARPWHETALTIEAVTTGDSVLAMSRPVDPEAGRGRYLHRPPRLLPSEQVEPIQIADAPGPVAPPAPLSWATLLAPIPVALIMAYFFRPIFALFAAMGPVMALFRWFESRRRHRSETAQRNELVARMTSESSTAAKRQAEDFARLKWLSHPHIAELSKRTQQHSVRLWERRRGGLGSMTAMVGVGPDRFDALTTGAPVDAEVHAALTRPLRTRSIPHVISLESTLGVGIHGPWAETAAVARSLVLQLASLHGPADLRIGVVCDPATRDHWDWLKWLPHLDRGLVSHSASVIARNLGASTNGASGVADGPIRLIVVDSSRADVASIYRSARQGNQQVRIIAIATHPTLLPAACSSLLQVHGAAAELSTPELSGRRAQLCPTGIGQSEAARWARSMTALVDPELTDFAVGSVGEIGLLKLVGVASAEDITRRWSGRPVDAAPQAILGVSDDGPFQIDLVKDGPHALIAGTTGSGKSELLRTLVLSLALECPPEQLNFVLIDFKGGGAFDAIEQLPHVAGVITDLDEALVARAVRSLRAELVRREGIFRNLGVSTFEEASRAITEEPLARVAIVIDEFAALATDYGDLLTSIVDLAGRGRSLGMHLVLATQRPSGVVDQKIRANSNLRVALRVQDAFDSQDVVGTKEAAFIDRKSPGRAVFSVGGDVPIQVQTAYTSMADQRSVRCSVQPHDLFGAQVAAADEFDSAGAIEPAPVTELHVLMDAIEQASSRRNHRARPLWSAPLPTSLDWIDLGSRALSPDGSLPAAPGDGIALGLVDVPERQTQQCWRWDPDSGALAVYGASAACAGKVLISIGAALASSADSSALHLYVIDGDGGSVAALTRLRNTGAYVTLAETDRIDRTLRLFETALDERRSAESDRRPRLVLLIDNLASVLSVHDDAAAASLLNRLSTLARDGAPHRLHLVVTARTARDVGNRLAQHIPNRLTMALADDNGYLSLGLRSSDVVALPAMRAIDLQLNRAVQIVEPPDLSSWSSDATSTAQLPMQVAEFPDTLSIDQVAHARVEGRTLCIPVGIDADTLSDVSLQLHPNEHALIVAGPGMGRSSLLMSIATQLERAEISVGVVRMGALGSPLLEAWAGSAPLPGREVSTVDQVRQLGDVDDRTVVLVDDAGRLAPELVAALEELLGADAPNMHVVAATTADFARSLGSWTKRLRASGTGAILGGTMGDGDVLGVRLGPLDGFGVLPGRGHLVGRGTMRAAQFGHP